MKVQALHFTDKIPEEYQEIHIEAFGTPFVFLQKEKYLLHPNTGTPITTLIVEGRTDEGQLIGFFIIIIQDTIGNIWSICKTRKYPIKRFFQKLLVHFLTHIFHIPHLVMLSSRDLVYEMNEKDRLFYYTSIGFRITRDSEIEDCNGTAHKVVEHTGDFIDVSGGRLPLSAIKGKNFDLRMLAFRDEVLRLH
jgi:hypothetical protein